MARVVVDVMPKPEILDPQGKAVLGALPRLGFDGVSDVRQGKRFELEIEGEVTPEKLAEVGQLGHRARHQAPEIFDDADAADQHAERGDHGEGQVAVVDAAEHDALYRQRRQAADDHAGRDADPDVAGQQADRIGDVGADRIIEQLVEADDAH